MPLCTALSLTCKKKLQALRHSVGRVAKAEEACICEQRAARRDASTRRSAPAGLARRPPQGLPSRNSSGVIWQTCSNQKARLPASSGPASAEQTPGTSRNGTPAAARAAISPETREKVEGQPPLSRTTRLPCVQGTCDPLSATHADNMSIVLSAEPCRTLLRETGLFVRHHSNQGAAIHENESAPWQRKIMLIPGARLLKQGSLFVTCRQ